MANKDRRFQRDRIHRRIRKKVVGTSARPRLAVCFTGRHVYAQVIEDGSGKTLAAVGTTQKDFQGDKSARANAATAGKVGTMIAKKAQALNIKTVVFDRGGFQYHGKVKALADAARSGGLEF